MSEIGLVQQVDINNELEQAYLSYAMSVIVSRALPDARDGLKPVHRRILYAMYDMGLLPERPYKKSARIVGEVLGKYHPHGDAAVYDAMVRMAQDFSMRYMLVDGQGNFGSVDGDSAAAMRYTEARLANPAIDLLTDLSKNTVNFGSNFDATLKEPLVLPALLPNLLVNGADGIAVGMSTKIPPHNIGEICDALEYLIANWDKQESIGAEQLMKFVQGPDFPTGGLVFRFREDKGNEGADTILNAYATGRGRLIVQAKTHFEEMSRNRMRIVVTELPYQTNKSNLIERIAELVRDGKLEGITDLRDESDRRGMRMVIELTRNVKPNDVLAQLFKYTPMRQTFGVIMLALVEGQPRLLTLKRALQLYVEHRQEVIRRRSQYDLDRAKERAHILEGLRIALANVDEVIAIIRKSQRVDTAKANLMQRFKLSDKQAQAILDMRLARLAQLERKKIEEEYAEIRKEITYLEDLLRSPAKILGVIRDDLKELKKRYAQPRRTLIITDAEYTGAVVESDTLIPEGETTILVTKKGELYRLPTTARRPRSGTEYQQIVTANNRHEVLIMGSNGRVWRMLVHQLPEKNGKNELIGSVLSGWERESRVTAILDIPGDEESLANTYLLAITRNGRVVRVTTTEARNLHTGTTLVNLEKGDEVLWAGLSKGTDEIFMVTAQGQAIRFTEEDVRPTGIGVQGVWGIKLEEKQDAVVGAGLSYEGNDLLIVSTNGMGKRTLIDDYPVQGRYGKGVRAMNLDKNTGAVGAAAIVEADERVTLTTNKRDTIDADVKQIPQTSRYHKGDPVTALSAGQQIKGITKWHFESAWQTLLDSRKRPKAKAAPPDSGEKPPKVAPATQAQLSLDLDGNTNGSTPKRKRK
jgi:DNA gyrase subunit A